MHAGYIAGISSESELSEPILRPAWCQVLNCTSETVLFSRATAPSRVCSHHLMTEMHWNFSQFYVYNVCYDNTATQETGLAEKTLPHNSLMTTSLKSPMQNEPKLGKGI